MLNRINEIYHDFQNFPAKNSVVRNNQENDAYTIYVLETLFNPYHSIRKFDRSDKDHLELIVKSIVPPPDDHIDIFFENSELDEKSYHIV